MEEKVNIWGLHNEISQEENLINTEVISIGWKELGDLSKIKLGTREEFNRHYNKSYPGNTKQSIAQSVGQIYRFIYEVKVGDYVVFPTKYNRMINIGQVIGEYFYDDEEKKYVHKRKVKWLKMLPRKNFSQGALYEVGSFLTLFKIKTYSEEFISALSNEKLKPQESVLITLDATIENTKDYILKKLSKHYKGYEFEEIIEELLNAMGYRTTRSQRGGDDGKDIIAYKDELPPRIVVQVKSQDADIQAEKVRSLKGAMTEGDYGLFVAISNYTKDAKKYLESVPVIKSINGSELAELILKYYDDMSDKFKEVIKLKRVFIPIEDDTEI